MTLPTSPLIYALDFPTLAEAEAGAARVKDAVGMLKVGLELFVEAGPRAVALGAGLGLPVFLDLKLHDIPETVERAVRRAEREAPDCVLVAVTVLTSLDDGDLAAQHIEGTAAEHAVRLARLAHGAGVGAFVCSPHEAASLRAALGPEVTLVTPGVRPAGAGGGDDQKRVATPARAMADGATFIVVGRPIRDAKDPLAAARAIADEALAARASKVAS